jgi:hypothetical protein
MRVTMSDLTNQPGVTPRSSSKLTPRKETPTSGYQQTQKQTLPQTSNHTEKRKDPATKPSRNAASQRCGSQIYQSSRRNYLEAGHHQQNDSAL